MADWLDALPEVRALTAEVEVGNDASRRLLERLGFHLVDEHEGRPAALHHRPSAAAVGRPRAPWARPPRAGRPARSARPLELVQQRVVAGLGRGQGVRPAACDRDRRVGRPVHQRRPDPQRQPLRRARLRVPAGTSAGSPPRSARAAWSPRPAPRRRPGPPCRRAARPRPHRRRPVPPRGVGSRCRLAAQRRGARPRSAPRARARRRPPPRPAAARDQPRHVVGHRGQVVEGPGPAAAGHPGPVVLDGRHDEAGLGQPLALRAGMGAVPLGRPEAAVHHDDQRRRATGRRQPNVGQVVGSGPVADGQVRRRRPGQDVPGHPCTAPPSTLRP